MNAPQFPRPASNYEPMRTTQAAEGLPRRAFTVAEIDALSEAGFFHEYDHFELIGGEIVPMNAKGIFHETMKMNLNLHLARTCPVHLRFIPETTYRLAADTFLEPDFLVFARSTPLKGIKGHDALLVIEVAHSSLNFDLKIKAGLYAGFGVPEFWVIDAVARVTHIHRDNTGTGYASITRHEANERLMPLLAPELAFCLDDFDPETD